MHLGSVAHGNREVDGHISDDLQAEGKLLRVNQILEAYAEERGHQTQDDNADVKSETKPSVRHDVSERDISRKLSFVQKLVSEVV